MGYFAVRRETTLTEITEIGFKILLFIQVCI